MAVQTKTEAGKPAVHEIAGGWITEKTGTEVPVFLRVAYVLIASACVGLSDPVHVWRSRSRRARAAREAVQLIDLHVGAADVHHRRSGSSFLHRCIGLRREKRP